MPLTETPPDSSTPPPASNKQQPIRISTGRYGDIDAHELIRLLDTIEDERARGRFRESLYISVFVWIAVAWVLFYGPRYLWHAPQLRDPVKVMREHDLTELSLPITPKMSAPAAKNAAPAPKPTVDRATMERLRAMTAKSAPAPTPAQPTPPMPAAATPPPPPVATPQPPRTPPPVVADAPSAQPLKPNFNNSTSAGDSIRAAVDAAARNRGGGNVGGGRPGHGPLNLGGAEVLSDTQGVDFGPYLRRILGDIKRNWDPLIPPEAGSPLFKQGETWIRFSINPDGTIKEMHLDGSTHDEAINRSCWGSITSEGQFPPLPTQFKGPNLELRIHYLVNKNPPSE